MDLIIHGRNVDVTDWIEEYVDKKVGKMERYLPAANEARVELTHNETRAAADRYTSQITIWTNGQILRAEESTSDIFASIDASADKIYRQIRRFKGRRYHLKRRASAAASAEAEIAATMAEDIGEALGCGAYLAALVRTGVQPFWDPKTWTLDELRRIKDDPDQDLDECLLPVESALTDWPQLEVTHDMTYYLLQGQPVQVARAPTRGLVRLMDASKGFIGLGAIMSDGRVAPKRMLRI